MLFRVGAPIEEVAGATGRHEDDVVVSLERPSGQGHHAEATAFWQAIAVGPAMPTEAMLATMRATIQATGTGGRV